MVRNSDRSGREENTQLEVKVMELTGAPVRGGGAAISGFSYKRNKEPFVRESSGGATFPACGSSRAAQMISNPGNPTGSSEAKRSALQYY